MKIKNLSLVVAKAFFILIISSSLLSCDPESLIKQEKIKRNYTVQLSNWVGSDIYLCDSIIWITDSHFKLKNKESREPFIDIIVPEGVVVRIYPNNN